MLFNLSLITLYIRPGKKKKEGIRASNGLKQPLALGRSGPQGLGVCLCLFFSIGPHTAALSSWQSCYQLGSLDSLLEIGKRPKEEFRQDIMGLRLQQQGSESK